MKKKIHRIDRLTVINAINDKFGTQRECAKALGIDETNLSNKLKRLSSKFLYQLKNIGVTLPNFYPEMMLTIKGNVNEPEETYNQRLKENEQFKSEIQELKKLLSLSVQRITALEEENEKLRSEVAALTAVDSHKGGGKINNQ